MRVNHSDLGGASGPSRLYGDCLSFVYSLVDYIHGIDSIYCHLIIHDQPSPARRSSAIKDRVEVVSI